MFKVVTYRAVTTRCIWLRLKYDWLMYIIPKPIIRIDSFFLTYHLSQPSHPSHLIVDGPRPSHPMDILQIKEGIFLLLVILYFLTGQMECCECNKKSACNVTL